MHPGGCQPLRSRSSLMTWARCIFHGMIDVPPRPSGNILSPPMQTLHVNGYDMSFLEGGQAPPMVCIHGSLCDFRIWSSVLGPLTRNHRVIAPSLRHFFPDRWDGGGDTYSMWQHFDGVIRFIEQIEPKPVDLMGHSRGGHIAFRVAQARPDLLRKLVLAGPGGDIDTRLDP